MPTYTLDQTAKTWAAAIGALVTALLGIFAGDTTAGWILTIIAAPKPGASGCTASIRLRLSRSCSACSASSISAC